MSLRWSRASGAVLCLVSALPLVAATCREAAEVGSEFAVLAGGAWLEVSCKNNPKDYCQDATAFASLLSARFREERTPRADAGSETFETRGDEPFSLDLVLIKESSSGVAVPVEDGDILQSDERIRLLVRPSRSAYVHVVSIDGGGVLTPLHASSGSTPIPAGSTVSIPEGSWGVEGYPGIEHLYVSASTAPDSQLDRILAPFALRPRSIVASPARVRAATAIDSPTARTAGAPLAFGAERWVPERFVAPAGFSLVVTHWFLHEEKP